MSIARTNILGVGVSAVNMALAVAAIEGWIQRRDPHYVCVATVNNIIECQRDPEFHRIHALSGMVTPDGMPLVWLSQLQGAQHVRRVYGPDLMLEMSAVSAKKGYRFFLYGGSEGIADRLAAKLIERYPSLQIVGTDTPPFRPLTPEEDQIAIEKINVAKPDIVWVGLSTPKQERWMASHVHKLNVPVLIGVGAAFDFHAGVKKQAPRWMQRSGLEWLHRLASEPRRLWKRYLISNPWFIWLVLLQLSGIKRYPMDD